MTEAANKTDVINECRARSIELLVENSTPDGINAASGTKRAEGRHYANIFGRDAAICVPGMVVSGDRRLIKCAGNSLLTIAKYQARNGQMPKYVKPAEKEADFWYTGCIDSTLWWLVAADFYHRSFPDEGLRKRLKDRIDLAVYWLSCQEHPGLYLVQQNEASDWADIMPRSGFVLYANALWYYVKKLYDLPFEQKTRHFFRYIFSPFEKPVPDNRRARILAHYVKKKTKQSDFYLSFVNLSFWGSEVDVFGNILAMLFGLSPLSRSSRRVDMLLDLHVNRPHPLRVVSSPIRRNSPAWRVYMERYKQNYPYQYHNGGIWPFTAGFWIILLHRLGRKRLAWEELRRYAEVNRVSNWQFNEWFHGKTGKPMGMPGQSWNAAMFLLALHCLENNKRIF